MIELEEICEPFYVDGCRIAVTRITEQEGCTCCGNCIVTKVRRIGRCLLCGVESFVSWEPCSRLEDSEYFLRKWENI